MSTKSELLLLLEQRRGEPISGQRISTQLGVTRSAVWKAVKELQAEGYVIHAVTNRGYTLDVQNDILSAEGILPLVDNPVLASHLTVCKQVASTNTLLKQKAAEGCPAPAALIAEEQTEGRGRRGRSFFSPPSSGLYLSLLLRPQNITGDQAALFTTAAAVAVCRGVEDVCGLNLQIKWVNDLFYQGKKVCGILTEAVTDFESGCVESIIVGVGINVALPSRIPAELSGIAGALSEGVTAPISRNKLCGAVLNRLMEAFSQLEGRDFLAEYRKRSLVLGRSITVLSPQGEYAAKAIDIGGDGELIVELPTGQTQRLDAGEVRILPAPLSTSNH